MIERGKKDLALRIVAEDTVTDAADRVKCDACSATSRRARRARQAKGFIAKDL